MHKIEYVKTETLKCHPNNPRTIKNAAFKKLCESIKEDPEYFEARPCLVNKDGIVFAGNQRLRAAQHLGLKEITVIVMDNPALEAKRMLRDNVSAGEWDFDVLTNSFDEKTIMEAGIEIDISEKAIKEEKILVPYKAVHVLISFPPELISKIAPILEKIKDIKGIEYEQSEN